MSGERFKGTAKGGDQSKKEEEGGLYMIERLAIPVYSNSP